MSDDRTVLFASQGLLSQISEVEWPKNLPLPKVPYVPKGSIVIEMPSEVHKGISRSPIGELYTCINKKGVYEWRLSD